jgi:hypothetical protein
VPFGVGAIEGSATRPLRVLPGGDGGPDLLDDVERAATDTNAGIVEPGDLESEERRAAESALRARAGTANAADPPSPAPAHEYGPGEEPRPKDGEPTGSAHGELL